MPQPPADAGTVQPQPHLLSFWDRPSAKWVESARHVTRPRPGLDFATADHLALAGTPALRAAALAALGQHRLLACDGEPDLPAPIRALQGRMAGFLGLSDSVTFTSGIEAIRTTFSAILRPGDHVIVDAGAASAMFETVLAARATLHRCPPGSVAAVERRLRRLSPMPKVSRLFIAVPAVAAFTSVTADLAELAALSARYRARLVVDASQDLGVIAQGGRGVMELQGCLGRIDIVLGSFAPCFGVPGGYAAFRDPDLAARARQAAVALSPVLAAATLAAFDLIDSPEGRRRRRRLHGNALRLRNHLMADGVAVLGQPSALVPVPLPAADALARTALLRSAGPNVPLLKSPEVARHAPRWLIRLSSDHGPADIDDLAELLRDLGRAFDLPRRRTSLMAGSHGRI